MRGPKIKGLTDEEKKQKTKLLKSKVLILKITRKFLKKSILTVPYKVTSIGKSKKGYGRF